MPVEEGQLSEKQKKEIMEKFKVGDEMAKKIQIAKTIPDARVPIQTNADVLRYYPGERR